MKTYERFLNYVRIHTASSEDSSSVPTTERQFDLAKLLVKELHAIGVENARVDDKCYVYASVAATPGCESCPAIGFIAHMDTVPDFSGENVQPRIIENYDGGDVVLGTSGRVLSPKKLPHLPSLKGKTLIVTDGTTVLGGDDKAGIAEIMTAIERVISENRPHGKLCIGFTPDEDFDVAGYTNKIVDMFAADRTVSVELLCENKLMKTIIDHYGEAVPTRTYDEEHFTANIEVDPSGTFYGWVFKFMGGIQIIAPHECVEEMKRIAHRFL